MPGKVSCQEVQIPARHVHVAGVFGNVKADQLSFQFRGMARLYACFTASLIERKGV